MSDTTPTNQDNRPRIALSAVKYLAFEGGGGAGNAFPGALDALEDLGILKNANQLQVGLLGVAGSSAGAINALFVSLGYNVSEMKAIMQQQDFNEFFDPVVAYQIPNLNGLEGVNVVGDPVDLWKKLHIKQLMEVAKFASSGIAGAIVQKALKKLASLRPDNTAEIYFGAYLASLLLKQLGRASEGVALQRIIEGLSNRQLLNSFLYDWGIFSGYAIREFFAKHIAEAVRRVKCPTNTGDTMALDGEQVELREITFAQHKKIFGLTLAVTGSNLESGKTEIFSALTTPNFPVADAVRISMSIPIAYKPFVLHTQTDLNQVGASLKGVWVDGGIFNNIPVTIFDQVAGGQLNTLGLRLRVDKSSEIRDIFDFLGVYPLGMALGSGESQISSTLSPALNRTIELDVTEEEMGLFDFSPDEATYQAVNKRSNDAIRAYFHAQ